MPKVVVTPSDVEQLHGLESFAKSNSQKIEAAVRERREIAAAIYELLGDEEATALVVRQELTIEAALEKAGLTVEEEAAA